MTAQRNHPEASDSPLPEGEGSALHPGRGVPKNFMVPWVLLLLKQWSAHGYFLMQNLQQMGFTGIDHTTLYKELRNLEKQGLVSSAWETDGSGPAKRTYTLTEAGEEFLKGWADTVAGYQRMITGFVDLYSRVIGWPPVGTGPAAQSPDQDKRTPPTNKRQ